MSDVLQVAARYRGRLKAELARVEEFLHMAEELSKGGDLESRLPFSRGNGEQGNGETAKPVEAKTVEAKAPESKPAESRPAESRSADSKPAESKPAEAKPTEARARAAEEPKTPFDRFRAASG